MPVVAYNTLGLTRTTYLRFDVPRADVEAVDTNGATLPSQVNAKVRVTRRAFQRVVPAGQALTRRRLGRTVAVRVC